MMKLESDSDLYAFTIDLAVLLLKDNTVNHLLSECVHKLLYLIPFYAKITSGVYS